MRSFWNKVYFYINDEQTNKPNSYKKSCKDIKRILNFLASKEIKKNRVAVGVHITNSKHIQMLNKEHRNKDSTTDVLSFPHNEYDRKNYYIGDIFINADIIDSQAKEIGSDPITEMTFLTMHGMLHLIGYDHQNEFDEEEMTGKQRLIFKELGIRND